MHKVALHTDGMSSDGPVEDFARHWNALADRQAGLANKFRPPFFGRIWDRYCKFPRVWEHRVRRISSYFVDLARVDCVEDASSDPGNQDEDASFHFGIYIETGSSQTIVTVLCPLALSC